MDYHKPNPQRPWALVAVMPQHQPRTIGRFANRSDAEAMMRFLQRKVPNGYYSVMFDPDDRSLDRLSSALDVPEMESHIQPQIEKHLAG